MVWTTVMKAISSVRLHAQINIPLFLLSSRFKGTPSLFEHVTECPKVCLTMENGQNRLS